MTGQVHHAIGANTLCGRDVLRLQVTASIEGTTCILCLMELIRRHGARHQYDLAASARRRLAEVRQSRESAA